MVPWDTPGVPGACISEGPHSMISLISNSSHLGPIQAPCTSGMPGSSRKSKIGWSTVCKKIQDECTNYMTLDSPRRATSYTVNRKTAKYDYYSYIFLRKNERRKEMAPQWGGPGRYRFTGPFTRMAVRGEVSGNWRCGAECPVYIKDPKAHNLKVGEMKENVHVCYRYTNKTWCHWKITITRCPGNYFVYWLRNLGPHMGYCGAK